MKWIYQQLMWIGISFGISLGISLLFPFYIALPLIIATFIGISFIRRRQMQKGLSLGYADRMGGGGGIKYHCIACGSKVKGDTCPNCGSKMKKADF